jgi:hypothetical protein
MRYIAKIDRRIKASMNGNWILHSYGTTKKRPRIKKIIRTDTKIILETT